MTAKFHIQKMHAAQVKSVNIQFMIGFYVVQGGIGVARIFAVGVHS